MASSRLDMVLPLRKRSSAVPKRVDVAVEGGDLGTLATSWRRWLEAADFAPSTVRIYTMSVAQLAAFLEDRRMPLVARNLTREHIQEFISAVREGAWPKPRPGRTVHPERKHQGTAETRYRGCKAFFDWLVKETEIKVSPMANVERPKVPQNPPPMLTDDQLKRLLKTCSGTSFEDRRDTAILLLFVDSGVRRSELAYLTLDDVDLDNNVIKVLGKFRRERTVPFGRKAALALDRYLRVRSAHRQANERAFWLGRQGPLADGAIDLMVRRRARQAGLPKTHAHLFRHGWAHERLASGTPETEVMSLAGWRSREMLSRYGASAAAERAIDGYRRRPSPADRL
jgi:site-specific recombinase XerD